MTIAFMLGLFYFTRAHAGLYVEAGLGVPLWVESGYTPDAYGLVGFGYNHPIDDVLSFQLGFEHRSLTDSDKGQCPHEDCYGDNAIEGKFRLEW